jgi:hypothetical protein
MSDWIESLCRQLGHTDPDVIATVRRTIEQHAAPFAWESTTEAYKPFLTEAQYRRLKPSYQRWYRPYRCAHCAASKPSFEDDAS